MAARSRNVHMVRFIALAALFTAGCAAGDPRFTTEAPAGFWVGLWHGVISCIALVLGIFYDSVEIYERANGGGWYDFGFLLGVAGFSGSGHHSHRRWRSSKPCKSEKPPGKGTARVNVDISWDGEDSEKRASEPVE